MKILMTADTVGGVWHYALSLCREFSAAGHTVVLATLGAALSDDQRVAAAGIARLVVAESRYRLEWMQNAGDDVAASGDWLLALADRHQPDLIHVNAYAHAALKFGRPVVCVAHSDVISWHHWVRRRAPTAEWDDYRFGVERGLGTATAIVAPTCAVRDDLVAGFGLPTNRCVVIANGIDLDDYASGEKLPEILCAGRIWDEAKNIALLARIAKRVAWPIVAAGDCHAPDGERNELAGLALLGRLDHSAMAGRFASAAIFAAPALYEPFGLAIAEAAASGCCLILSDIPSLHEIWGDAALYVPANDDHIWAAVLNWVIASPACRRSLGAAAQERARGYSADRMAARYLDLYAHVGAQTEVAHA